MPLLLWLIENSSEGTVTEILMGNPGMIPALWISLSEYKYRLLGLLMHAKCSSYVFFLEQQRTITRKKIYYPQGFKYGDFARFSRLLDYTAQLRGLETANTHIYVLQKFCESLYTSFASDCAIKWDYGFEKFIDLGFDIYSEIPQAK